MREKLNILFLCSWYPSRVLPTNGDFVQRHAEAVSTQHKVTVFHIITDANCVKKIEISDEIVQNVRTLIAYVKPTSNLLFKVLRFRKAQNELLKKVNKIDIIHVNKLFPMGIFALQLKRKLNIPFIVSEHHSMYQNPYFKSISFLEKKISKLIATRASFICPVSDDLGKAMQQFGLKGNYHKVPNVVNTKLFTVKEKYNKKFTLLHVSNMVSIKNVEGILRVIKRVEEKISSFHFYCIGANATSYVATANTLKIKNKNTTFINQVPHKELIAYYQKASVFLLFSDTENQPCVIPEAFSTGTPVIATNVGGISEYFPDDFGILIEPRNEDALFDAILKLHKSLKTSNATEMHGYIEQNFSESQICDTFTKLYNKALK